MKKFELHKQLIVQDKILKNPNIKLLEDIEKIEAANFRPYMETKINAFDVISEVDIASNDDVMIYLTSDG